FVPNEVLLENQAAQAAEQQAAESAAMAAPIVAPVVAPVAEVLAEVSPTVDTVVVEPAAEADVRQAPRSVLVAPVLSAEPAPVEASPIEAVPTEAAPVVDAAPAVVPEVVATPVLDSEPEVPAIIEKQPAVTAAVEAAPEPVVVHHEAGECVETEAVLEDAVIEINPVEAAVRGHAHAGMTKAPAPAYTPSAPAVSSWVRPTYQFTGRGAAGSQAATHHASAAAAKPQSVE
ncbi:MAG: ribonuclease E, partial [Plesiomonas sp.]